MPRFLPAVGEGKLTVKKNSRHRTSPHNSEVDFLSRSIAANGDVIFERRDGWEKKKKSHHNLFIFLINIQKTENTCGYKIITMAWIILYKFSDTIQDKNTNIWEEFFSF